MTKVTQHSTICSGMEQTDRVLYSCHGKTEHERSGNRTTHQYIPMDVYVDPETINKHFHASAIHDRRTGK